MGDGESVEFSVVEGGKGRLEARNVSGPDGSRLQGSDRAISKAQLAERIKARKQVHTHILPSPPRGQDWGLR